MKQALGTYLLRRASTLSLAAAMALVAPAALAQGTKTAAPTAKPGAKTDAKKVSDDQRQAEAAEDQRRADDQKKADDAKTAAQQKQAEEAAKAQAAPTTTEPPAPVWDIKDVEEIPTKKYLFVGARYRGNIIPKFMLNMFVDEGATVYSNSLAVELDMRKDGFSLIPALGFTEYGTGDILFKEKDSNSSVPGNYSFVNSSMKAVYATVDLLWSVKMSKHFDFEYGAGFGLGAVFGNLVNNWVTPDPNGQFTASNGQRFSKCATEGAPGSGCNRADHRNTDTAKVGNYTEPSWFSGGSKPVLFPWISIPQFSLRYKPVKNFVARLGVGFSLTGFWFGLNGAYGLEHKPEP